MSDPTATSAGNLADILNQTGNSTKLRLVSLPDSAYVGNMIIAVANLSQSCKSGEDDDEEEYYEYLPLPNREIHFYLTDADCGSGEYISSTSAFTDSSGNATGILWLGSIGESRIRVKFSGEGKPSPCPTPGNNACDPFNSSANQRCVELSASNACESFVAVDTLIPLSVVAHSPVNVIVTDPELDSIGVSFNTISGAHYDVASDSIYIPSMKTGDYAIRVVEDTADNSADSSYDLIARVNGYAPASLASFSRLPVGGESHDYVINYEGSGSECLSIPGDANGDGMLTLTDVVAVISYLFYKPGCNPAPECWFNGLHCRGDWDADSSVNLIDVVIGTNCIFMKSGGPWKPVSNGLCCQPLL
ncbi:MAG: hypothetical protein L0Y74_04805 [candidate division Zixibacteria bacterium]|nr:hypothetical protein [candidate division Zixibacteria bacterium]